MSKKETCPECGTETIPIVYGLPGAGLMKKAKKGKIRLGGCVIYPGAPTWHCPQCDNEFGSLDLFWLKGE